METSYNKYNETRFTNESSTSSKTVQMISDHHKEPRRTGKWMLNWLNGVAFNKKDEYYTPKIMVSPIISYLKPGSTIWCPFDTEKSEFVRVFTEEGFKVIYSHIWAGQDFFEYEPSEPYDYIISNPPFTRKLDVLRRLYLLNKPFAMILGLPILNYQIVGEFFLDKNLELMIFYKKVSFDGNTASFNCSYFCNCILPKGIVFYHLPNNNTGDNFIPSRMAAYEYRPEKTNKYQRSGLLHNN